LPAKAAISQIVIRTENKQNFLTYTCKKS